MSASVTCGLCGGRRSPILNVRTREVSDHTLCAHCDRVCKIYGCAACVKVAAAKNS